MARDCKVAWKCTECESDRHIAAMHPGTAPQASIAPTLAPEESEEGKELMRDPAPTVTSKCTDICGEGQPAMSCSKICLVRVFAQGQRDKAINTYAVLDDQSNRSLARPKIFELFNVKSHSPH